MRKNIFLRPHDEAEQGVALVIALIVTLVVMIMIFSILYVTTNTTTMSGAGKRYETAAAAADGAVEVMEDSIGPLMLGASESSTPFTNIQGDLKTAITNLNQPALVTLPLLGTTLGTTYKATVKIERIFEKPIYAHSARFPPTFIAGGTVRALFYRISSSVTEQGPNPAVAESTALYRYVGQ